MLSIIIVTIAVVLIFAIAFGAGTARGNLEHNTSRYEAPKSAKETLEDLKYQEELDKNYELISEYWLMGEQIENPTPEQRESNLLMHKTYYRKRDSNV